MNRTHLRIRDASASPSTALVIGMILVGACGGHAETTSTPPGPLTIDAIADSSPTQGVDFDLALVARGGRDNVTWSLTSGQLPPGLALADTSYRTLRVSGRPAKVGAFTFEVGVVDSQGQRATRSVGLTVASSLAVEGDPFPDGTEGLPYREQLSAVGGSGPGYRWRVSAGALPDGLMLSGGDTPALTLEGVPKPGRFAFTITVADSDGNERSREITLWVHSSLVIEGDPQRALVGDPFDLALHMRGGIGPYDWRVVAGSIAGLELTADDAGARLHGTPAIPGTTTLRIEATDHNQDRVERALNIDLRDRLQITTETLPSGQHGVAYSTDISGIGGLDDAYHWEVVAGTLPDGLTLAAEGAPTAKLAGTPMVNGSFAFTVRLSTSDGTRVDRAVHLDVRVNPPQLVGKTLPAGSWGDGYADAITGTSLVGGAVQWKIIDGWLPPGVELEATTSTTVTVRGRPAVSGPFDFTLQMTDPGGVAHARFHVDIGAIDPFQLIGRTLPRGRVGDAYTAALETRNALGDVSWRIASDELPPGVVLQSDGPRAQLVGTPTTAGFYRFTVEATADGHASNRRLAMLVHPVTSWMLVAHGGSSDGPYAVSVADVTTLPTTPVVVKDGLQGWVGDLTVSPDGRYATFTSGDLVRKSLYLVDLRGGPHPAVLLTTSLRGDRGLPVTWSPDGVFAIVPVQVADFEFDMHMLDLSGASHSFRSLGIARAGLERAWAPDGNSVAFASPSGDIVYVATRSDSSWSTSVIPTGATALWPLRWLPDASGLLFSANGTNQGLFFVDPNAAAPLPMRLTQPRFFYNPNLISVTEDGTRIILTNCCGSLDENRTIWVFDTSRQAFAQAVEMTGGLGGPVAASWSPDSRHLLVSDERSRAMHIVDADAPPNAPPAPLQVTGLDGPLQTVAWMPDGLSLLATTNTAVYRIPAFATPEADQLLGGFSRSPLTWFLGAHSPFVFIQEGGVQAIDLSIPADQRVALRVDTVGSGNHFFREDPLRERVYYSDLTVDHDSLYVVDVSGASPAVPIELLRVPFIGNEGFSD